MIYMSLSHNFLSHIDTGLDFTSIHHNYISKLYNQQTSLSKHMRSQQRTQNCSIKISRNNPQSAIQTQKKPASIVPNKSPIISRKPKGILDESICFISPKKIAYFQGIDESCLNESQKDILKRQCQKTESTISNVCLNQSQIDYRSIKKCLSPRPLCVQSQSQKVIKSMDPSRSKLMPSKLMDQNDANFKQRLIMDLKMEILQMGQLLQQKQIIIEQKNIRIAELQRELLRQQVNQSISVSIKSISTLMQDRTPSIFDSFSQINCEQNNDKLCELEQRLRNYEHQLKKFQIQIDILRKYRYESKKNQLEMLGTMKKNESLTRKINRLMNKNSRLMQELEKFRQEGADRSIVLQYSPEKYGLQ